MRELFHFYDGVTKPAYEYRSFHVDAARHMVSIEELKKMLKTAAYFGMNHFHFHISDDQGYRLESKRFPLLNQVSSFRSGDHFGKVRTEEREGGFYTGEQIKDLVNYATSLGIEIVPELDVPGHLTAVIAAYPYISCSEKKIPVANKEGIYTDILCPGKESSFAFVYELLEEILEMFPGKYIHIGGDETPKTSWKTCPCCQKKMKNLSLKTEQEYQGWMTNKIAEFLGQKGRQTICWNEASYGDNLSPKITIQYWTKDKNNCISNHIRRGGNVICSQMMNSYADYPYGFISTKKFYKIELEPKDIKEALYDENCAERGRVIGNECLIWTEYIREEEQLEKMAWPRFAASAAAGFMGKERPSYKKFENALRKDYGIFEKYGVFATELAESNPGFFVSVRQMLEFKNQLDPELTKNYKAVEKEI